MIAAYMLAVHYYCLYTFVPSRIRTSRLLHLLHRGQIEKYALDSWPRGVPKNTSRLWELETMITLRVYRNQWMSNKQMFWAVLLYLRALHHLGWQVKPCDWLNQGPKHLNHQIQHCISHFHCWCKLWSLFCLESSISSMFVLHWPY